MRITEILMDIDIPESMQDKTVSSLTARADRIEKDTLFFLTESVAYNKQKLLPFKEKAYLLPTTDFSPQEEGLWRLSNAKNMQKAKNKAS